MSDVLLSEPLQLIKLAMEHRRNTAVWAEDEELLEECKWRLEIIKSIEDEEYARQVKIFNERHRKRICGKN